MMSNQVGGLASINSRSEFSPTRWHVTCSCHSLGVMISAVDMLTEAGYEDRQ
jgi:hypothetical protein